MKKMYRYSEYFQCSPSVEYFTCEDHEPKYPGGEASAIIDLLDVPSETVCRLCESKKRQAALESNKIHWFLYSEGKLIFDSKDRWTFWNFVKANRRSFPNYETKEMY